MHLNPVHTEKRVPALRQLIRSQPLGVLTTAIASARHPLLQASHVPWLLDVADEASATERGVLRGHLARANPQCQAMLESLGRQEEATKGTTSKDDTEEKAPPGPRTLAQEVMVLFTSPVHGYVTPRFYAETGRTHRRAVPTWDYQAVQAYGRATVHFDARAPATRAFLARAVGDLSAYCETAIMGHSGGTCPGGGAVAAAGVEKKTTTTPAWQMDEAPPAYVELLLKAIVGIEIEIDRLEGVTKMSQEKAEADRVGVIAGFEALGTEAGREMADKVREWHEMKRAEGEGKKKEAGSAG